MYVQVLSAGLLARRPTLYIAAGKDVKQVRSPEELDVCRIQSLRSVMCTGAAFCVMEGSPIGGVEISIVEEDAEVMRR